MPVRNQGVKLLQFAHPLSQKGFDVSSPQTRNPNQIQSPKSTKRPSNLGQFLSPKTPSTPHYRIPSAVWESTPALIVQSPQDYRAVNMHPIAYPFYCSIRQSCLRNQCFDKIDDGFSPPATMNKEEDDENDAVEEICRSISELYLKLPLELREQVTLEIMKRGKLTTTSSNYYHEPALNLAFPSSRGLQGPVQNKPQRFKMKTLNAVGVATNGEEVDK